ncbi:hypothetical protein [Tenacibaculum finnmarkense]|uniref:hypothetical protein n=1 Tax=Tenacibaculum finnmarkense TaxID=2781243 RepID=UPI00187B43DA|nr:hypothetical protein [Tenacibaculum finnmarkense]MBE7649157.1 hypothetical protein [Tenacibaculum finnmarkense genomovar ulcerans]
MINVIKQPRQNAVFLSNSPLDIDIKSEFDSDYYFKVFLFVNTILYDEQGWAKHNKTDCRIDLKNMFTQVFENQFQEVKSNDLMRKENLLKKIYVNIKEYKRIDDSIQNKAYLEWFYILKSNKDMFFDERISLQKMSSLPAVLRLSKDAVFRMPIWVNTSTIQIKVSGDNQEFLSEKHEDLEMGIFEADFILKDFFEKSNEIRITISDGEHTLTQIIQLMDIYSYDVSRIFFKNNFDIFEYIELFGSEKESNKYSRKIYNLPNDLKFTATTTQEKRFKINTGNILPSEFVILELLNNSNEIYLKNEGAFIPVIPVSSKSKGRESDKFYHNDYIEFQQNGQIIANQDFKYD